MRNYKKSLKDFLKSSKIQKLQKSEKSKLKGGTINEDLDLL